MNVRLLQEAEDEAQKAVDWYDDSQPGLGEVFLQVLRNAFERIGEDPLFYARDESTHTRRNIRRCPLPRFSYSVIYEVLPDEILFLAVAHHSRRPGYWKRRHG